MTKKKTPETPEDFRAPGRHWGGDFGFDVGHDGSVYLPNGPRDKLAHIYDRRQALESLLKSVTEILKIDHMVLNKEEREWWRWISEQTKIDINQNWSCNFKTGLLTPPKSEDKEP